jgi:hypothetical protein
MVERNDMLSPIGRKWEQRYLRGFVTQHLEEIADFVDFIETIFSVPDSMSSILFTPTIICLTPACEPKGHAPSLTIREYLPQILLSRHQ